jgi:hypothetical protein
MVSLLNKIIRMPLRASVAPLLCSDGAKQPMQSMCPQIVQFSPDYTMAKRKREDKTYKDAIIKAVSSPLQPSNTRKSKTTIMNEEGLDSTKFNRVLAGTTELLSQLTASDLSAPIELANVIAAVVDEVFNHYNSSKKTVAGRRDGVLVALVKESDQEDEVMAFIQSKSPPPGGPTKRFLKELRVACKEKFPLFKYGRTELFDTMFTRYWSQQGKDTSSNSAPWSEINHVAPDDESRFSQRVLSDLEAKCVTLPNSSVIFWTRR